MVLKAAYTPLLWLLLSPLSSSITTGLPSPPSFFRASFTAVFAAASATTFTASSIAFWYIVT